LADQFGISLTKTNDFIVVDIVENFPMMCVVV